jgi:hypothetical protein
MKHDSYQQNLSKCFCIISQNLKFSLVQNIRIGSFPTAIDCIPTFSLQPAHASFGIVGRPVNVKPERKF